MRHCIQGAVKLARNQGLGCGSSQGQKTYSWRRRCGEKQFTELTKPDKIGLRDLVEIRRERLQVCHTVLHNGDPLIIETFRAVKIKHDTSANDRIEGHQLALVRTRELRPTVS